MFGAEGAGAPLSRPSQLAPYAVCWTGCVADGVCVSQRAGSKVWAVLCRLFPSVIRGVRLCYVGDLLYPVCADLGHLETWFLVSSSGDMICVRVKLKLVLTLTFWNVGLDFSSPWLKQSSILKKKKTNPPVSQFKLSLVHSTILIHIKVAWGLRWDLNYLIIKSIYFRDTSLMCDVSLNSVLQLCCRY